MELATVQELGEKIQSDLVSETTKKSIALLFAFNATGKTRLSLELDEQNSNEEGNLKVLSYNALLEDSFTWDNENYIYKFEQISWFSQVLIEQGVETAIAENFRAITNSKVEPTFDFEVGEITFSVATGDDTAESNIKISRGEESVFVWCVFHSILEMAIETLNTKPELRTTDIFNDLELVVVDDPVSSIDDARIIAIALNLFKTIKDSSNSQLNFLITTHHALFYNVLFNCLRKKKSNGRFFYTLSKASDNTFMLEDHAHDSPFAYHLAMKDKIAKAIEDGYIEKYHFNLFRGLLEKTANFLGYRQWSDCIDGDHKEEFSRVINHYSHSKLSELESGAVGEADKQLFIRTFEVFIDKYNYQ